MLNNLLTLHATVVIDDPADKDVRLGRVGNLLTAQIIVSDRDNLSGAWQLYGLNLS